MNLSIAAQTHTLISTPDVDLRFFSGPWAAQSHSADSTLKLHLIGDWHTAKLYEAIQSEFYLKDWKASLRAKLDNLESIVQTIKDNLSVSWENLMDRIQLALWLSCFLDIFTCIFSMRVGSPFRQIN